MVFSVSTSPAHRELVKNVKFVWERVSEKIGGKTLCFPYFPSWEHPHGSKASLSFSSLHFPEGSFSTTHWWIIEKLPHSFLKQRETFKWLLSPSPQHIPSSGGFPRQQETALPPCTVWPWTVPLCAHTCPLAFIKTKVTDRSKDPKGVYEPWLPRV